MEFRRIKSVKELDQILSDIFGVEPKDSTDAKLEETIKQAGVLSKACKAMESLLDKLGLSEDDAVQALALLLKSKTGAMPNEDVPFIARLESYKEDFAKASFITAMMAETFEVSDHKELLKISSTLTSAIATGKQGFVDDSIRTLKNSQEEAKCDCEHCKESNKDTNAVDDIDSLIIGIVKDIMEGK